MEPSFLVVGHLRRPHGTRGDIFVEPLTDHPDTVFAPGARLRVSDPDGDAPDELFPPLEVTEVRPHRNGLLVRFQGIQDRDRLDFFRNRYLLIPFEQAAPLAQGELFQHQLVGLTVVTGEGDQVGTVREIYDQGPVDLLAVTTEEGEILIPFTREVVVEWDLEERRLVVDPPEGLLDL